MDCYSQVIQEVRCKNPVKISDLLRSLEDKFGLDEDHANSLLRTLKRLGFIDVVNITFIIFTQKEVE